MNQRASARRRAVSGVLDQALSSASNLAILVFVARTSSVQEFGGFTLAYLLYGLALGLGRAVGGEILLISAGRRPDSRRRDTRGLLGLALEFGVAGAGLLIVMSFVVPFALQGPIRGMAVALPIVLLQDALRYGFFADQRLSAAITMDAVWLAAQGGVYALIAFGGHEGETDLAILGWAFGAGASVVYGVWRIRLVPRLGATKRWLNVHRANVKSFFTDFVLLTGSVYLSVYAIGAVAGLAAVAAFQGAYMVFSPFDSLLSGARMFTLPALARASTPDSLRVVRVARTLTLYTAGAAAAYGAFAVALPPEAGRVILGATWAAAAPVVPAIALAYLGRTASLPAIDGLRAMGSGRRLVTLRVLTSLLSLVTMVVGASLDGARGAASGLAAGYVLMVTLWWVGLARAADTRKTDAGTD